MTKMQRVEVLMSVRLRKDIDKYRKLDGESISGYIRRAVYERSFKLKKQKVS